MRLYLCLLFITFSITACRAEPSDDKLVQSGIDIQTETIADGLNYPWAVAFLSGGGYLVTERPGDLIHIDESGHKTTIQNTPGVYDRGQGGLLDVIIGQGDMIYLSYAAAADDNPDLANTEVVKARLNLKEHRLENPEVIFKATPKVEGGNHWGSRLLLDDAGGLFVTLGERFDYRDQAQNPDNYLGTVAYVAPDGEAEVYTYGNRNVQGIARHPVTSEVWIHEHGPKGGDEVNILEKGTNYGWPNVSYGVRYSGREISETGEHAPEYHPPLLHWTPSIAPSGMAFYQGDIFPEWQNDLLVGALVKQHLRRVKLDGSDVVEQEKLLEDMQARIRDVAVDDAGYIYVLTDSDNGKLIRLSR